MNHLRDASILRIPILEHGDTMWDPTENIVAIAASQTSHFQNAGQRGTPLGDFECSVFLRDKLRGELRIPSNHMGKSLASLINLATLVFFYILSMNECAINLV